MSKAKVTKLYPKAVEERRNTYGSGSYYLVRLRPGDLPYIGCGSTPRAAWRDAWARIQEREKERTRGRRP